MNSRSASCLSHSPLFSSRPLHLAARNGLATVVQALLSRGATVLAVDEEGEAFFMLCYPSSLITDKMLCHIVVIKSLDFLISLATFIML